MGIFMGGSRGHMYSYYFPPNEAHDDFLQVLSKLEDDLRMARGEVLVAGGLQLQGVRVGL